MRQALPIPALARYASFAGSRDAVAHTLSILDDMLLAHSDTDGKLIVFELLAPVRIAGLAWWVPADMWQSFRVYLEQGRPLPPQADQVIGFELLHYRPSAAGNGLSVETVVQPAA